MADGVQSIVLREGMDIDDRRRLADLLNATHEYKWAVDLFGEVDISPEACYLERFNNFEAMSKVRPYKFTLRSRHDNIYNCPTHYTTKHCTRVQPNIKDIRANVLLG